MANLIFFKIWFKLSKITEESFLNNSNLANESMNKLTSLAFVVMHSEKPATFLRATDVRNAPKIDSFGQNKASKK